MIRVFYNYISANFAGIMTHAEKQMKKLGINYYYCEPQSLFDGWEFWIDDEKEKDLPDYIEKVTWREYRGE